MIAKKSTNPTITEWSLNGLKFKAENRKLNRNRKHPRIDFDFRKSISSTSPAYIRQNKAHKMIIMNKQKIYNK